MIKKLDISAFLEEVQQSTSPLVDVRAPKEFAKGHIPGAINLPIFNDEERKTVGILYKQKGREDAFIKGLEYVGPKMAGFVADMKANSQDNKLFVHCWRGGMRSESMAWLWSTAGFDVSVLSGGYKAYRNFVLKQFEQTYHLVVIGGKTGSGKTSILHALEQEGEQIIDLEGLANHKGSVFGAIHQPPQPTVVQFENNLYNQLRMLNPEKRIWVEAESHAIGKVYVPMPLFEQMQSASMLMVEIPDEVRVARLVEEYADCDRALLKEALDRIKKRLGGKNTQLVTEALRNNDFHTAAAIALTYYDKTYTYAIQQRPGPTITTLTLTHDNPEQTAKLLIDHYQRYLSQ